ncbi:MAG: outer membrane beta-barrel protein [Reichenbachiella sp.]|uniref:outer membrane beta-barrel protein n=1 Tax=Reichenbachiella sp. TaxID=2184521 RepID=UPI003267B62D
MKPLMILVLMLCGCAISKAQHSVGLGLGANLSQINFKNSEGEKDDRIKGEIGFGVHFTGQKTINYSRRNKAKTGDNVIELKVGFEQISFRNKENNILQSWKMNNLSTTLMFKHFGSQESAVYPFFGAGVYMDYMIGGTQESGLEQYDLTAYLERKNLGVLANVGVAYYISAESSATLGFTYARGLSDLEPAEQSLTIGDFKIEVTLLFHISK